MTVRSTRPALVAAVLALASAAAHADYDPAKGKLLFTDTINQSGLSQITGNCTSCHTNVQNRRTKIGGDQFAAIEPGHALDRIGSALNNVGAMKQFQALDADQLTDLAAYIADTPTTSEAALSFSAGAVNTPTAAQNIDLKNGVTFGQLTIDSVGITGAGAQHFTLKTDGCTAQKLAASASCRATVSFTSGDTATHGATLTLTMRVTGSSTAFTRTVELAGAVGTVTPPPTGGSGGGGAKNDDDSGGGALGWGWLAGLALATAALRRRPHGRAGA